MNDDDEVRSLWAAQTAVPLEIDMQKMTMEADQFSRGVRRRNALELGAGAFVAVVFALYAAWFDAPLARFGALGVVVGVGVVAAVTLRWGREAPLPPADLSTTAFLEAYRAALLRQARLLAWAPAWYVLPLLVPAALFAVGLGSFAPAMVSVIVLVGLGISAQNLVAAARLRREASAVGAALPAADA